MLRYRRPRTKPIAAAVAKPKPRQQHIGIESILGFCWAVLLLGGALRMMVVLASFSPVANVGDRITFDHINRQAMLTAAPMVTGRHITTGLAEPGSWCRLDSRALDTDGGILTVAAVRPDGVMLSWAGKTAAATRTDCRAGGGAVLVSPTDYATLFASRQPRHS